MFIALLLARPRLTAVGGVAVVASLKLEVVAVIHAARPPVILDGTLILTTRRAVDGVERTGTELVS